MSILPELFNKINIFKRRGSAQPAPSDQDRLNAANKDIQQIEGLQATSDSSGATRQADAERLDKLRATKAELEATINPVQEVQTPAVAQPEAAAPVQTPPTEKAA